LKVFLSSVMNGKKNSGGHMYKLSIGNLMKHYRNEKRFEGLGLGAAGSEV